MTVQEVAAETGALQEETYFTLPPGSAAVLWQIEGFASFDEKSEVLLALKASTGTVGAPRAFSLKLAKVTRGPPFYLRPLSRDSEMEVCHRQLTTTGDTTLRLALAKHIDDLKVIAKPPAVTLFRHTLEAVFGKLKYHEGELKNTGIEHKPFPDGSIEMGQTTYIQGIQPIDSAVLVGKDADTLADEPVVGMYRSVLGAVAYTQLTQLHTLVYIVAAQRQKPTIQLICTAGGSMLFSGISNCIPKS